MSGEISVSDVNGLARTVNFFLDINSYLRCMPCGCLFVLDGEGQQKEQHARSVMDSVDFNKEPERLQAVVSSPENMERIKGWLGDAGLSPELACTFDDFVLDLEMAMREQSPKLDETIDLSEDLRKDHVSIHRGVDGPSL